MPINRSIAESDWAQKRGYIKHTSQDADEVNRHIDLLKVKIYQAESQLMEENDDFDPDALKG